MRRSACFLTIVGLSLNSVAAQDMFNRASAPPQQTATSRQYFNSTVTGEAAPSKNLQPPSVGQQVPNYYQELFGETPQPAEARSRLRPASPIESATPATPSPSYNDVVQAEFRSDSEPTGIVDSTGQCRKPTFSRSEHLLPTKRI